MAFGPLLSTPLIKDIIGHYHENITDLDKFCGERSDHEINGSVGNIGPDTLIEVLVTALLRSWAVVPSSCNTIARFDSLMTRLSYDDSLGDDDSADDADSTNDWQSNCCRGLKISSGLEDGMFFALFCGRCTRRKPCLACLFLAVQGQTNP